MELYSNISSNTCNYCFENDIYIDYNESLSVCKNCGNAQEIQLFDMDFKDRQNHECNYTNESSFLIDEYISNIHSITNDESKMKSLNDKKQVKNSIIKVYCDHIYNMPFEIPIYIKERCVSLFRKILKKYKCNHKKSNALFLACLYYSYRAETIEHSIDELAKYFDTNPKTVYNMMKYIDIFTTKYVINSWQWSASG